MGNVHHMWKADARAVTKAAMRHLFVLGAAFIITACTTSLTRDAARPDLAGHAAQGRWAVRLGGKPVTIIALQQDENAVGGWSGNRMVPQLRMTGDHSFSNIKGPAYTHKIVWAQSSGDRALEFKVGSDPETITFRVLRNGTALLGWKGIPVDPLVLSRAATHESVPDAWDPANVYRGEDGHKSH